MKRILISPILAVVFVFAAQAQESNGSCGTTIDDQSQYTARLQANILKAESGAVTERGAVQYVPIHFHIVGDAGGAGKHREDYILDQLCNLNEAYAPMDIRFFLNPHPTYGLFDYSINHNNVYDSQTNEFLMSNRKHSGALNVFVVNQVLGDASILGFYNTQKDWVVCRKNQINGNGNGTLEHEIGHLFSLRHTFYGWEVDGENSSQLPCFESGDPGWPVAPVTAPYSGGGTIFTERQNGSNCATAADLICDTPPDYNFGYCASSCAPYNGGAKDPLGTLVNPMENNFMGYFLNCSTYVFTPMQQDVILADLDAPDRNYLNNNFTPISTGISTPTDLLINPPNDITVDYYDEVLVEWQAVDGADRYLLEFDVIASYGSPLRQAFILSETSKLVTSLSPNKKYYWRVRPFNQYVTCAPSRERSFRTSLTSSTTDIKELTALQIAPNPIAGSAAARLFVQSDRSFEAFVHLLNGTGARVKTLGNQQFPVGDTTLDLPTEGLPGGLYFVVMESESGRAVRKLTVVR